ncbi:hypothetical protein M569_15497 [Genlisea aurea]|uniref:Uncharacterized protein n=1 Tax=Genlisea aurea TaxID=192259 RepID=S8C4H1_9LAMI|nr:hypothetical protein M569_15497 [Genlisea aurea]
MNGSPLERITRSLITERNKVVNGVFYNGHRCLCCDFYGLLILQLLNPPDNVAFNISNREKNSGVGKCSYG